MRPTVKQHTRISRNAWARTFEESGYERIYRHWSFGQNQGLLYRIHFKTEWGVGDGFIQNTGASEKFVDSTYFSESDFVEERWRSLFRTTSSLVKRCTSYNAPPTSRKRAADRWSLRNFLPRSSLFMVGKISWGEIWIEFCFRLGKSGSVEPHQNIRHTVQISPYVAIFGLFHPWRWSSEARNFEVINGLQHVSKKWVERCKKCIACQGRYFEKETVTAPP
jgi:hypothetical protein